MSPSHKLRTSVNGRAVEAEVEPRLLLSDFLRQDLALTGTHVGCEHGVCGACTVLLDGEPVRSCLMLAVQVEGRELLTVEGLAPNPDELHPLQQGFWEAHGLQCGFCTPGFLMTLLPFLQENPNPTEAEIREAISLFCWNEIKTSGTIITRSMAKSMTTATPIATRTSDHNARLAEPITTAAAVAIIGPINGATIMAPITVAVDSESTP